MAAVVIKNSTQTKQHQAVSKQHHAVHGHIRYLVSAVGKLDLQSCVPHIAESGSLKNRIALYRWSLNDFKKAVQRDMELDGRAFSGSPSLKDILKENQEILQQINRALTLAENSLNTDILREELNVALVKINLAVNAICETVKLKMVKEDALAKIS